MPLFLSPHLDDAALSCGGTMYRLARAGAPVTMLTLMAADPPDPPPDTPVVRALHTRWSLGEQPSAARRREDVRAAAVLGARARYAGLRDCIYRAGPDGAALYPNGDSLWGRVHPADPAPAALRALALPPAQTIYAPLGIGTHVDHLIVRDWALTLARPGVTLVFYTDYPYARDRAAQALALAAFAPGALTPQTRPLTPAAVRARIAAVASYDSQVGSFWPDRAALERELLRAMLEAGDGAPAERFWVYNGGPAA